MGSRPDLSDEYKSQDPAYLQDQDQLAYCIMRAFKHVSLKEQQ